MASKVGVLGSGQVAQVLAKGFKAKGYDVQIGSREPQKLSDFEKTKGITAGTFASVAAFGDMIVLAVKGTAALDALKLAGDKHLAGKIVIDATNPIAEAPAINGVIPFFTGPNDSLMERLQKGFPQSRFVKAFSCVGNAFMVDPKFEGGKPTMFICGNDNDAKNEVKHVLDQFGWDTEDMGQAESARAIEPLCQLWCIPGLLRNEWTHAFKLLKLR